MNASSVRAIVLAAVVATPHAIASSASSQLPPSSSGSPSFRSRVDLVALNVTLTDEHGRFVGGLSQDDFAVLEDGVPQEISFFAAGRMPLDLAVLLDASASMWSVLSKAQDAAIGFVRTLRTADRISIIEISDRANVLAPLGDDLDSAADAIRRTRARGSTALYNALYIALTDMNKSRRETTDVRRQAIAVLSDGHDTSSLVPYDDVLALAKDSGIAIYTIALGSPGKGRWVASTKSGVQAQFVMRSFAQATGGLNLVAQDVQQLDALYTEIADVLAQQYTLGYVSTNRKADGAFRRVSVTVMNHRGVSARTRSGYYAPRERQGRLAH